MLDKAYGSLIATAIGDAMGMPASFMSPTQIKRVYGKITDFLPPDEAQTAHNAVEAGGITDDTQESLIISSVLIEAGRFDTELFVEKMRHWANEYKMLDSTVIGPSTRKFLKVILSGGDYLEAGKQGDTNGAAMRVAPIGIFNHGNMEKAIEDAVSSALPSHGSRAGVATACAIAAAIAKSVEGKCSTREVMEAAIYGAQVGEQRGFDQPAPSVAARIRLAMELVDRHRNKPITEICENLYDYIGAGMKCYESVPLSLGVFHAASGDVTKGILSVINIGDDADTNGAIVGALCGAYSGASTINPDWIAKIESTNAINFKQIAKDLLGSAADVKE
ncbi:ADP-ribosylglycohydrolase family protein [Fictibacillus sp. B-59209]|uniref:ADP-ribosylglycohydrolase family protein n=1 Tax=Fictibacillus sp. B-59209 TaxID=3024873 RepID=UPI002E1E74CD|nr:ADP-ribosylglycohydrolase family protein [Fictibacillus sp. B-59209]